MKTQASSGEDLSLLWYTLHVLILTMVPDWL